MEVAWLSSKSNNAVQCKVLKEFWYFYFQTGFAEFLLIQILLRAEQ